MTTATRTTKAGPISRTITIGFAIAGRCEARVTEVQGAKTATDAYLLCRQPSDFGVALSVRKMADDGEQYDVLLNSPGGHSCACKWGTYKPNSKPCRHVEMALQALRERQL